MGNPNSRKLFAILILAFGLALLLYFQPWNIERNPPPRIVDRLPVADVMGKSNVLSFSRSLSKTMFYYRIPFRDFISPDFMLSQGKNYGLDVQAPVYFFANEKNNRLDDWGLMLSVKDSSKVREGIVHLRKFIDVQSKKHLNHTVYLYPKESIFMAYGNDWMFVYGGDHFEKQLTKVLTSKRNEIAPAWREFINESRYLSNDFLAKVNMEKLRELGIESSLISMSNDSSSIVLHAQVTHENAYRIALDTTGPAFDEKTFTKHLVNFHFIRNREQKFEDSRLHKKITELAAKIGFPLESFLESWEGDIAFRQGGIQTIQERYIESELDDNFNVTEVVKYRPVEVPAFSLYLSMNSTSQRFLRQLESRGILTEEGNKHRLLFSPPLNLRKTDSSLVFHTSKFTPKLYESSMQQAIWTVNYTPYQLYLDSTKNHTLYARVRIPLKKLVKDYIPTRK